jgi:hypothetical protein
LSSCPPLDEDRLAAAEVTGGEGALVTTGAGADVVGTDGAGALAAVAVAPLEGAGVGLTTVTVRVALGDCFAGRRCRTWRTGGSARCVGVLATAGASPDDTESGSEAMPMRCPAI